MNVSHYGTLAFNVHAHYTFVFSALSCGFIAGWAQPNELNGYAYTYAYAYAHCACMRVIITACRRRYTNWCSYNQTATVTRLAASDLQSFVTMMTGRDAQRCMEGRNKKKGGQKMKRGCISVLNDRTNVSLS